MTGAEIFQALGGGIAGLLGVVVAALFSMVIYQLNERIKDRDKQIAYRDNLISERDQTIERQNVSIRAQDVRIDALAQATERQTDLMRSWMPTRQYETLRSPGSSRE